MLKRGIIMMAAFLFTIGANAADAYALIKDLASQDVKVRTAAVTELLKMGEAAKPILWEVVDAEDTPKNLKYFEEALEKAIADKEYPKDIESAKTSIAKIKSSRAVLAKVGVTEALDPRQLYLLRRLFGSLIVKKNELRPIDTAGLTPFGSDKENKIAGNPDLLFNMDKKIIVMEGEFAIEQGPLEYLIVTKGQNARLHETIASVYARPRDICYALLACAYTYAGELGSEGKINLPKDAGVTISVEFLWEEPHANMDPNLDISGLAEGLLAKQAKYESATADADKKALRFDLESDIGVLKVALDRDLYNDKTRELIAKTPFQPPFDQDRDLDDAKRKTLIGAISEFVHKMVAAGTVIDNKTPPVERRMVRLPIEAFAWNSQTDNTMRQAPFAFTGSKFEKDDNGKPVFMADEEKSVVALKLDPYAILNSPLDTRDIDPQHAAGYGVNQYINARRHARCRVIFEPWAGGNWEDHDKGVDKGPAAPPKAP